MMTQKTSPTNYAHATMAEMVKHLIEAGRPHSGVAEGAPQRGHLEARGEPEQDEASLVATPIHEQMRWLQERAERGR